MTSPITVTYLQDKSVRISNETHSATIPQISRYDRRCNREIHTRVDVGAASAAGVFINLRLIGAPASALNDFAPFGAVVEKHNDFGLHLTIKASSVHVITPTGGEQSCDAR